MRCEMVKNILRRPAVEQASGLKRSSLYEEIEKGNFPKPVRIGARAVGWIEEEVVAWQRARVAERDGKAA